MPRSARDYSKAVIYRLEHIDKPELFYIGATADFTRRKYQHKRNTINTRENPNLQLGNTMYNIIDKTGGWESYRICPIKEIPCENARQLHIEEYKVITDLRPTLNTQVMNNNLLDLIKKIEAEKINTI
tara:strand:+ start:240 stop:623 length:384 start_codon:yes stop_codon:yes gene_type:complete